MRCGGQSERVVAAEVSGADDADAERVGGEGLGGMAAVVDRRGVARQGPA